jgi:hypothetical protein
VLVLRPFKDRSQGHQLIAVGHCDCFKLFDFLGDLVDDALRYYLFSGAPGASLFIVGLSKEELEVEQVAEAAALEDVHFNAGKKRFFLFFGSLFDVFEGADELPVQLIDAVVQK